MRVISVLTTRSIYETSRPAAVPNMSPVCDAFPGGFCCAFARLLPCQPKQRKLLIAQSTQDRLAIAADAKLAIARLAIQMRVAFLKEVGIGAEFYLLVAHAIAHARLICAERRSVVESRKGPHAVIIDFHDGIAIVHSILGNM